MVTWENYEEYLMMDADGELDAAGKAALQAFFDANPSLEDERQVYAGLKLRPDATMLYTGKEELLKEERKGIVISLRPVILAVAAAVVALIILFTALWPEHPQPTQFAHSFSPTSNDALPVPGRDTITSHRKPDRHRPLERKRSIAAIANVRHTPQVIRITHGEQSVRAIAALPTVGGSPISRAEVVVQPAMREETREAEKSPVANGSKATTMPVVHFASRNQPAVNLIRQALSERITQASEAAKTIKETALTIKLGRGININL